MLTLERELCRAYRVARAGFDADPFDERRHLAFLAAAEDLAAFIRDDFGRPAEDFDALLQYELDRNGEVQEIPLDPDAYLAWVVHGAA